MMYALLSFLFNTHVLLYLHTIAAVCTGTWGMPSGWHVCGVAFDCPLAYHARTDPHPPAAMPDDANGGGRARIVLLRSFSELSGSIIFFWPSVEINTFFLSLMTKPVLVWEVKSCFKKKQCERFLASYFILAITLFLEICRRFRVYIHALCKLQLKIFYL